MVELYKMPQSDLAADSRLAQLLSASLDPSIPVYILVDPMLGEPLAMIDSAEKGIDMKASREAAWQRYIQPIEMPSHTPLARYQYPYLILLKNVEDPLLKMTLTIALAEHVDGLTDGLDGDGNASLRIGGWLQSSLQPQQLAEILGKMFRVNTDAHTKATYLRLADRRVFALLRNVAGDIRVASQFGRLQCWYYLNANGALDHLSSPNDEPVKLRLNWQEWCRMEQGEALQRTLICWLGEAARMGKSIFSERPVCEIYDAVRQAIAEAQQATQKWPERFLAVKDQTIWAVLLLLYPATTQSKAVHTFMQQSGDDKEFPEPIRNIYREIIALLAP